MYDSFNGQFMANPQCQIGGYPVSEQEAPTNDDQNDDTESKETEEEGADEDKKINMMEQMAKLWLQQEVKYSTNFRRSHPTMLLLFFLLGE